MTGMQEEACAPLTRNEGALPLLQKLRVALELGMNPCRWAKNSEERVVH